MKSTAQEKKRYVLSTDTDFEILAQCKILEKQKLTPEDKQFVKFLKTQLEADWRKPLLKTLDKLLEKYDQVK